MDPDRLSFASQAVAEDPGLLEPQRLDLESWREEEGVLRYAAVVSRVAVAGELKMSGVRL